MTTSTEESISPALEWAKWLAVVVLAGAAIVGNWYFQDQSIFLRVLGVVTLAAAAVYISSLTLKGHAALELIRGARSEIRRVVWPTNQETTQTTLVVLVLIALFSLILWLLDWLLSALVTAVIG